MRVHSLQCHGRERSAYAYYAVTTGQCGSYNCAVIPSLGCWGWWAPGLKLLLHNAMRSTATRSTMAFIDRGRCGAHAGQLLARRSQRRALRGCTLTGGRLGRRFCRRRLCRRRLGRRGRGLRGCATHARTARVSEPAAKSSTCMVCWSCLGSLRHVPHARCFVVVQCLQLLGLVGALVEIAPAQRHA